MHKLSFLVFEKRGKKVIKYFSKKQAIISRACFLINYVYETKMIQRKNRFFAVFWNCFLNVFCGSRILGTNLIAPHY